MNFADLCGVAGFFILLMTVPLWIWELLTCYARDRRAAPGVCFGLLLQAIYLIWGTV